MGNYNSYAYEIMGPEWVAIREEDFELSPSVTVIEQGHGFTLAQSRIVVDARFYTNNYPQGDASGQAFTAAIYPRGYEDHTGPIQQVIIPCNSAAVTGGTATTTVVGDLADPSDDNATLLNGDQNDRIAAFFAVNNYPMLNGKRILNVELLYTAYTFDNFDDFFTDIQIENATGTDMSFGPMQGASDGPVSSVFSLSLGELNHFALGTPVSTSERLPWRYQDLQRFEATAGATRLNVAFRTFTADTTDNMFVGYAALRVTYCEEARVAVGGRIFGNTPGGAAFTVGVNTITLRTVDTHAVNPALVAGDYDVVISAVNAGSFGFGGSISSSAYPPINAIRQLYAMPEHPGVRVNVTQDVGDVFTAEEVNVLPQISVHTTGGGVLTEVHVYGRQVAAPVYGSVTAAQDIRDSALTDISFPYVRYYARRFGDTSVSLLLSTTSPTISGSSVTLTPAEWDALPEIVDGWKEVTKRFNVVPIMGNISGQPTWTWSASGELVGNRWEVLGMRAPAISGIPGNLTQEVPSAQRLGSATYGAPTIGATTLLTWLAPPASGVSADPSADATLIFSTLPPSVTGVGVTVEYLPVESLGTICGLTSSCAPTGVAYHEVTWAPIVSGVSFGSIELQRMDEYDTEWQTIMLTTNPGVVSFRDYEARVGVESSYRARTLNLYEFEGDWSSTVTSTIPAPGVSGSTGAGVLIFTTNETQDGSAVLAYSETWDRVERTEEFIFPEADTVVLQRLYGKNYQTAFRPAERGGESFTRTLLIKDAAVSTPELDRVAESLRNLAWLDVSYVCVRNELGDRWLATVIIPDAQVKRNRRLHLVRATIIEATDTPSPVDPEA